MNRYFLLLIFCFFIRASLFAEESLLRGPNFTGIGGPGSPWQVMAEKGGKAEPATAADGRTSAVHLMAATVAQTVTLPAGLYELTAQARGEGELLLRVGGEGERSQMLGKQWATYGYLFEIPAGDRIVSIGVSVDGVVGAASILPANEDQKAAWARQQESLRQFGFANISAQRPAPSAAAVQFDGNIKPLTAMTRLAVLDEPRLNTVWAKNVDRLVDWLGSNGFARLDGVKLPAWMTERIQHGDAYGSVVVVPRGVTPVALSEGATGKPLWLEYIRAGGRIVHAGDMPFNDAESPVVAPSDENTPAQGAVLLGLSYGWDSPYCGEADLPLTRTPAAEAWGIETTDSPITGVPIENVSLAFHVYTVPKTGKQGASDWFRNVRPDMPWSGLVKLLQNADFNSDAALRDVWRTAHYVGTPVVIPALPPPIESDVASSPRITMSAGGMEGRHEFVRGEEVNVTVAGEDALKATGVRLELQQDDKTLFSKDQSGASPSFNLKTAPFADGTYTLKVSALRGDRTVKTSSEKIGIRYLPPESFNFEILYSAGSNPLRTDMEFADIAATGLELYLTNPDVLSVDPAVRRHLGFSIRGDADPNSLAGKAVTFEKNPEYFRLDNNGKPIGTAYSGGRPSLGISHPEMLANATRAMREEVGRVAGIPAFRPYVMCNDDFSVYYGWDYTPRVLADFKKETGLDAPRKMQLPPRFGPIPDNDPWVKWFEWTLINVDGAFNKAETEGVVQARADARVGPIPGAMQIPLVSMWEPAQYPPYNFGKNGFNLISSYYYNTYWQPVMTATFWMEIGRMGDRDLPEWNLADSFSTAGYTRNNFYHYLAGGVSGLAYFSYAARSGNAWPELHRLAQVAQRIGPAQVQLHPAHRDIGLLNSFTSNCFDPIHTISQAYGYNNLMQGHFSVEPVSEDEIVAGLASSYKAILLYNIQYLRQSVYDALVKHAANGGLVLLDRSVPFDIPGAKRLDVDIGTGAQKTLPMPPEGAHLSTPSINDYGHADRIEIIKQAVAVYVKPQFDSSDIKVVAKSFEADGVPYTWFVNAQDGQEYLFCREPYSDPNGRNPAKMKQVSDWEAAKMAQGPYTTTIVYKSLPGIPYDLVHGRKFDVKKTKDGRLAVTVSMDRFGGSLVAWLPTPISGITLDAPARVKLLETVHVIATIRCDGQPAPGVLPVEFKLKDPHGKESVVLGVHATKDGSAAVEWTPAVNDPVGKWTLTAMEFATNKSIERTIRVSAK